MLLCCFLTRYRVLCPSHLAKQWHSEIEKHCKNELKVIVFVGIREFRKKSVLDILEAGEKTQHF